MSGPVKDPLRSLQGARSRAQGGRLEEQIEASCALLTETGRADISKTPEPMKPVSQPNKSGQFRAVYTKKAEPDFKGVMLGGRAVMFEAKSTGTGRLNKDRVLPEQVKKLDSYTALGAHCFIVATFDGLRVYRIPWTVWRSMKQRYGRNYVTEADIKEYAVRFGPGFTPGPTAWHPDDVRHQPAFQRERCTHGVLWDALRDAARDGRVARGRVQI